MLMSVGEWIKGSVPSSLLDVLNDYTGHFREDSTRTPDEDRGRHLVIFSKGS